MRSTNFVSFFTVQGFFIGVVFSILKSESAYGLLVYTLLVTAIFYLLAHFFVALYFQTFQAKSQFFPKEMHERQLDLFVREIGKREKMIEAAQEVTRSAVKLNADEARRSAA